MDDGDFYAYVMFYSKGSAVLARTRLNNNLVINGSAVKVRPSVSNLKDHPLLEQPLSRYVGSSHKSSPFHPYFQWVFYLHQSCTMLKLQSLESKKMQAKLEGAITTSHTKRLDSK